MQLQKFTAKYHADLHLRLKLRVEVVIMKYKLVFTRL